MHLFQNVPGRRGPETQRRGVDSGTEPAADRTEVWAGQTTRRANRHSGRRGRPRLSLNKTYSVCCSNILAAPAYSVHPALRGALEEPEWFFVYLNGAGSYMCSPLRSDCPTSCCQSIRVKPSWLQSRRVLLIPPSNKKKQQPPRLPWRWAHVRCFTVIYSVSALFFLCVPSFWHQLLVVYFPITEGGHTALVFITPTSRGASLSASNQFWAKGRRSKQNSLLLKNFFASAVQGHCILYIYIYISIVIRLWKPECNWAELLDAWYHEGRTPLLPSFAGYIRAPTAWSASSTPWIALWPLERRHAFPLWFSVDKL